MFVKESGFWPTPRASGGAHLGANPTDTTLRRKEAGQANLSEFVQETTRTFPTPCARDYRSPNKMPFSQRGGGKKGEQLVNFIRHFPTPRSASSTGGGVGLDGGSRARSYLVRQYGEAEAKALCGGQLNPDWVEWLMGWPVGWTDLGPTNPQTFQEWLRTSSIALGDLRQSVTAKSPNARHSHGERLQENLK